MKKSFRAISIAICIAMVSSSSVYADELPILDAEISSSEAVNDEQASEETIDDQTSKETDVEQVSKEDCYIDFSTEDAVKEEGSTEPKDDKTKGMLHQVIDEDGNKYLEYDDGSHYMGWYEMEPFGWLYFDPQKDGEAATGIYQITEDETSKLYFFDDNGINIRTSGTPVIGGNKYWIKEDGSLGWGWLYLGSWKMYFDPSTLWARNASDGVVDIDGEKYLFNEDGVMQTFAGTTIVNGAKYWFSDDGTLKCGWLTLGDWKLYFDTDTYKGAVGIKEIDGISYLFDSNGVLMENSGTIMVDGNKYCIENGSVRTGWVTVGAWKLYFDPETGIAATKVTKIDGKNYIFDKNGVNITGSGTFLAGGNKYYIDSEGNAVTGWVTLGDWKLYFDPETGIAATGVVTVDGKKYDFNSDGICLGEYVESEALRLARAKLNEIGWSLRAAYNWSKSMQYNGTMAYPDQIAAGVKHSEYYATFGFTHGYGNCYIMAATFLYMARVLGYEGNFIEGQVPYRAGGYGPHGWCELIINGTTYVFDPNFEHDTGRNGYQITYGASGTWKYTNWRVVD